ncbi:MAG: tRNA (N6-isopentenyl adenosine(37)-C2)-methylthiotransferase MiaB [Pseudomonadota bacterium]|nr:tRNA (N6-isopentenyl adenosine(37)-C2)-methylthiotransferase MiaB [Pseudomonadota bacterium]
MTKKLFIKSFGCQMNVYDSERMAEVLAPLGYGAVDDGADADMVVLNTCHIREKAAEKVYSELGRLALIKAAREAAGETTVIAVAGCVAQAEGDEILRRANCVDVVVGPQAYHRLPDLVARVERDGGAVSDTDFPAESKFDQLPGERAPRGVSAFLSVQEGCDKFCSFCVVPYTRGAEYSRPVAQVVAEARQLVLGGAREIVLLGQNVNAYHGDKDGKTWGLGRLIWTLADIDGLERLRYTTSHPLDMDDELIAAHGAVPALMPYLHLPVQSGSDRVLRAMNRRHGIDDYRRVVGRLCAIRPDLALSGDFIVGFPGESDDDFAATLAVVAELGYAQAYSFKYSPRPATPGAARPDQIPDDVKAARLDALQSLLRVQQNAFNQASVGQVLPVLFERPGRHPGQLVGRSPYMQAVHAALPSAVVGDIVDMRIIEAQANSLAGVAAEPERTVA